MYRIKSLIFIRCYGWAGAIKDAGSKTYGDDDRLIMGNRDNGGLGDVNDNWHDNTNDNIGFRVLAVLYVFLIQPPIRLPILCNSVCRVINFC